ncbi:hypothetical protein CRE_09191 [Caenorhabditis remanei]|uniref:CYtochrome P450 family n=1 Tax=Caenorhabditis remanei TaxID=31234 RepID=E3LHE6_CAERE|nr:hypothetical protein CRE_09191 [Caenorhabditis remanei]
MILLLILIAGFSFWFLNTWRAISKLPKGPFPLPLVGNFPQIGYYAWKNGGLVGGLNEIKMKYGKVFTLWMGPIQTVHVADYDVAYETHIKRAHTFGHRYSEGGMDYIREGRGIIASVGDLWVEHRRNSGNFRRGFGALYRFDDFKKTHWKNEAVQVQTNTFFDYLVGSIINQLLVSERFEYGDQEFEKLKKYLTQTLENLSLLDAFAPLWLLKSDLMKWRTKTTLAPFDYIFGLVKKTIQKRVEAIDKGEHVISEEGDDFVDAFLMKMKKDKEDGVNSTFNLESLSIDLYDLWLAGQETTSTTLTWACVCFLNHPEVVGKMRKELGHVTGGHRSISLTDRAHTPYLNATINEVQRIASILNFNLLRVLKENTTIDGQPISAGATFSTQLCLLHTDEANFKNPTEFQPERFLENNNLEKKLIPFGIGKRSCLGESLARAELYLILGNLIMEYDLEPVGVKPELKTPSPFAIMKRPPNYDIRFVPRNR